MSIAISVPIGVIVARERSSDPWHDYRWRPVSVVMNPPEGAAWREVERGRDFVRYHAATMPLVLTAKEKIAYRVNLANGVPSVYVVLREDRATGAAMPVSVAHLTASPFEIQAFGQDFDDGMSDIVERVPMPEQLVQLLQSYVDGKIQSAPLSSANQVAAHLGSVPPVPVSPAATRRSLFWGGDFARMKFSG
ncbi:MAG: DUF3305 domain-containing protein [Hyphomicrobium sp.]